MPFYHCVAEMEFNGYGWTNAWRVNAPDFETAKVAGQAIGFFHVAMQLSVVRVVQVHVALAPDPTKENFVAVPIDELGAVPVSAPDLPDPQACLFVWLAPVAGLPGKKFLRYAISQQEFQGGGRKSLITSADVTTRFAAAATALITALNAANAPLTIGENNRPANTLVLRGMANQDVDHAWFNRTNNTPITG